MGYGPLLLCVLIVRECVDVCEGVMVCVCMCITRVEVVVGVESLVLRMIRILLHHPTTEINKHSQQQQPVTHTSQTMNIL